MRFITEIYTRLVFPPISHLQSNHKDSLFSVVAVAMGSDGSPLHFALFPFMSPGHMLPVLDMALLFVRRGVRVTIITTPSNAATVRPTLDRAASPLLSLHLIPFPPPSATGLNPGQENLSAVPAAHFHTFMDALTLFEPPIASLLRSLRPDCLLSDALFHWTSDLAASLSIPRLVFHGPSAFSMYLLDNLPYPFTDSTFTVDNIRFHTDTLPDILHNPPLVEKLAIAEPKCYGVILNTFHAAEPRYVDYMKAKSRAWCVGPACLYNEIFANSDKHTVLRWLDDQPAGSVVYVCFGSLFHFSKSQLRELAVGLEASGQRFVWVVRREATEDEAAEWMPEGFEEGVAGRGVVVRGWCPQRAVLGHDAVGWFVTHCGWNSVLEALSAGVGMVTWPLFHEQFMNQELVVEVMGAGVRMWGGGGRREVVMAEEIEGVLKRVGGGGEEVEPVLQRAAEYKVAACEAVEEGGTTYCDVTDLLNDLEAKRSGGGTTSCDVTDFNES